MIDGCLIPAYMRKRDPRALSAHSNQTSSEPFEEIVGRLTRPTTASQAARHDFDAQACHIDYLRQTCKYNINRAEAQSTKLSLCVKPHYGF